MKKREKKTLCEQVQDEIRELVRQSEGNDESLILPSERELATRMKVSRLTARNAYHALVNEGLLVTGPRGYRIAERRYEGVLTLDGFSRGSIDRTQVLTRLVGFGEADDEEAKEALSLGEDESLLLLKRLRMVDAQPFQVESCFLPASRFADIGDEKDFSSLYDIFERRYNIRVVRAEQIMKISTPSRESARLLGVSERQQILRLRRISYDQRGIPVEFVRLSLNPAGREFFMELKR